jgi:hypothetical protein
MDTKQAARAIEVVVARDGLSYQLGAAAERIRQAAQARESGQWVYACLLLDSAREWVLRYELMCEAGNGPKEPRRMPRHVG